MRTFFILLSILAINTAFGQVLKDCSICSKQVIKAEQIKNLSTDDLRFLTNDLFARRGYKFKSQDVDSFYQEKSWYKPISDNNKIVYNDIEKQNIKLFQEKTAEINMDRKNFINELKAFKTAILAKNKSELSSRFGYALDEAEQYNSLTETLKRIDLDDINWSYNTANYKITIDNGDIVMNYGIAIESESFSIRYGSQGGSEFGKLVYPNDQISEGAFLWEFQWKNGRIKFLKMDIAG